MPQALRLAGSAKSEDNGLVPYDNFEYIAKQLDAFRDIDGLILGGGLGVEKFAEDWAKDRNVPYSTIRPNFAAHGGERAHAFKSRNVAIIERSHRLIVFWDGIPNGPLGAVLADAMTLKKEVHLLPLEI
jgi:hypothetical protein